MAEIRTFNDLLGALHRDHLDILDVLRVIEQQLTAMEAGADGDFLLLSDCVDYLDKYANCVHHAGEDILFDHVAQHLGGFGPVVAALQGEHEELRRMTDTLREELACVESDTPCDRAAFLALLRRYVGLQRAHLEQEEREVYPAIAAWIRKERTAQALPLAADDPLLAEDTRTRYRALHDHITGARQA